MTNEPRDIEGQLEELTAWPDTDAKPTLWSEALDAPERPMSFRFPSRRIMSVAACLMLGTVGLFVAVIVLDDEEVSPVARRVARLADPQFAASVYPTEEIAGSEYPFMMADSADVQPRAIHRSAAMELTTEAIRPLFNRVTALIDPSLGEFVESASANEGRADATLRVSAQRLDTVMRSIRDMDGVTEVLREELSAVDATDRRADLAARLANERRIEVELLGLIDKRPDAPLADVLRVREALSEVRLNIERLDAQRATLSERVALATLRVSIVQIAEEQEPEPDASGFLHDLGDAFTRGGQTLAGSAAWIVEAIVGGLIAWAILAVVGIWAYRTLRWRATWA